jgi:ribosomal-protein-alanine N-acetyltransferase
MPTARVELVPHSPQGLRALVDGYDQFAQIFGIPAAAGLRDSFASGEASSDWLAQLAAATTADPWTFGFGVVHRVDQLVIGAAGFKGPPAVESERRVCEIAYGIVPTYRSQGFATETAAALVNYAVANGQVTLVRAHTLPEPNASTRVLTKCGFQKVGEVIDPDDGLVWRWERNVGN